MNDKPRLEWTKRPDIDVWDCEIGTIVFTPGSKKPYGAFMGTAWAYHEALETLQIAVEENKIAEVHRIAAAFGMELVEKKETINDNNHIKRN